MGLRVAVEIGIIVGALAPWVESRKVESLWKSLPSPKPEIDANNLPSNAVEASEKKGKETMLLTEEKIVPNLQNSETIENRVAIAFISKRSRRWKEKRQQNPKAKWQQQTGVKQRRRKAILLRKTQP